MIYNESTVKICKTLGVVSSKSQAKTREEIDPGWTWGQNRGLNDNKGRDGNFGLQEGELPKFPLCCPLSRRWVSQGQGSLQMSMKQSNNQTQKKTYYDY